MKILSIIIPGYNVEKYLEETLDSLLRCKNREELDIIIVNDGSTDHTKKIAGEYEYHNEGIVSVINKENGGHGSAINSGLRAAKGKYLIVVDGDDWVDADILDRFIKFLADKNTDVVVTGHYKNFVNTGVEERYAYKEKGGLLTDVEYLVRHNHRIPMTDICYKTELLRKTGLKIQENTFYVDEEFCSLPFLWVKTILFFSEGFYHYRIGDINQSISNINMVKRIDHKIRVFSRIMCSLREEERDPANSEYIRRKMAGLANSILLVYYIYFPERKSGREKGDIFRDRLKRDYPEIYTDCKRIGRIFRIMNLFFIGPKMWDFYKRMKQRILERKGNGRG